MLVLTSCKVSHELHVFNVFCVVFFMCSYNKLEDDFQLESDPLRAYNDYLEDVENISKYYLSLLVTW